MIKLKLKSSNSIKVKLSRTQVKLKTQIIWNSLDMYLHKLQTCNLIDGWVKHHFIKHQSNLNIIFWTSNKIEHERLLVIELKHSTFWFWMNGHQIGPSLDLLNYLSNRIKHWFLNIKRIRTCLSFGNRTRTSYFWLWTWNF